MSIEHDIVTTIQQLTPQHQQEVRDFAEFLRLRQPVAGPRRSIIGSGKDLGIEITDEDIAQARREMWGAFPRDLPE